MLKKFINGLVFGAGFGMAFVAVWIIAIYFIFPAFVKGRFESGVVNHSEKEITTVPKVEESKRFLGYPATYSGDFQDNNTGVLSRGPGQIIGSVSSNDGPVEGLRLRLALNGSVMSQWAITGASGKYKINVPYGKYAIDGFELDVSTANRVLANKINYPQNAHSSSTFEVSEKNEGRGLDLKFVDPILKKIDKSKFSTSEAVVLEWEPFPRATEYFVQIYEKTDPYTWSNNALFQWSDRPKLSEARINLKEYGVPLKPGHFYVLEIEASDERHRILSETVRTSSGYDFEVVE